MKRFLCLFLALIFLLTSTAFAKSENKYEIHFFDELNSRIFFDDNYIYHMNLDNILTLIKPSVGVVIDEGLGYSLIDSDNKWLLFTDGVLWVKKGKKIGAIDQKGNVIVDFIYDDIKHISEGMVVCKKEKYYGCVDIKGNLIADFIYSDISRFKNEKANALLQGNNLILKKDGQIDTHYDLPYGFISEFTNGFAFVRDEPVYSKWCPRLPTAAVVTEYAIMNDFVYWGMPQNPTPEEWNNAIEFVKYGYRFIDEQGKIIIDGLEANLSCWKGIYFTPSYFTKGGVAKACKDNKQYVIDREGNIICNFVTDFLGIPAWIGKRDNEYVSVSYETGEVKILGEYDSVISDSAIGTSGYAKVKKGNNFGIIDNDGNIILPCEFDDINRFAHGFFTTKRGSEKYIYSAKHNAFIPNDYEYIKSEKINDEIVIFVQKDGKRSVVNSETLQITAAEYDKIYSLYGDKITVGNGDKMGIIDSNSNIVVPIAYDFAKYNGGKYALVMNHDEFSLYDVHNGETKYIGYNNYFDAMLGNYIKVYSEEQKKTELFDWYGNKVFSVESGFFTYAYKIINGCAEDIFVYITYNKDETGNIIETRYFIDSDFKLIYYIKNDQVFDAQSNKLFDNGKLFSYSNTAFKGIYKPSNAPKNLMAVYERPFPKNEYNGKYICLMLNNPLINLNGEIELLEKDNWFMHPAVENNRALVPVRRILEALGASVSWLENSQTIICKKDNKTVELTIGKQDVLVNGKKVVLDSVPKLIGGRAFFPLRAVSEALGAHVDWDENDQLITITF